MRNAKLLQFTLATWICAVLLAAVMVHLNFSRTTLVLDNVGNGFLTWDLFGWPLHAGVCTYVVNLPSQKIIWDYQLGFDGGAVILDVLVALVFIANPFAFAHLSRTEHRICVLYFACTLLANCVTRSETILQETRLIHFECRGAPLFWKLEIPYIVEERLRFAVGSESGLPSAFLPTWWSAPKLLFNLIFLNSPLVFWLVYLRRKAWNFENKTERPKEQIVKADKNATGAVEIQAHQPQ